MRPCKACAKQEHEVNHPPGMVFVGWGRGWQTCVTCDGTGELPSITSTYDTWRIYGDQKAVSDMQTADRSRMLGSFPCDKLERLADSSNVDVAREARNEIARRVALSL